MTVQSAISSVMAAGVIKQAVLLVGIAVFVLGGLVVRSDRDRGLALLSAGLAAATIALNDVSGFELAIGETGELVLVLGAIAGALGLLRDELKKGDKSLRSVSGQR